MTAGEIRPEPEGRRIPAPIRRLLLRGLSSDPSARYPSMAALLGELPASSGARRFACGG